jgi:hypothetical protein
VTDRELNKSLIENQKQWKERVHQLEEENRRVEQDTSMRVADLEGQVRVCLPVHRTQRPSLPAA